MNLNGQLQRALHVGRRLGKGLLIGIGAYVTIATLLTLVYAWFNPPVSAMMLLRKAQGEGTTRQWVPFAKISPHLARAVILSEDARFCSHWGVDWRETGAAVENAFEGGKLRGASTITMQTMKNLYLWPGRDPLRKLMELPLALIADAVWSKRRILEIYLNIAEWAPGVFGAEAAARHYFRKSAAGLGAAEAAQLAALLPNPLAGKPGVLRPSLGRRMTIIQRKMQTSGWAADCVAAPWVAEKKQPAKRRAPARAAPGRAEPDASAATANRRRPPAARPSISDDQPWRYGVE